MTTVLTRTTAALGLCSALTLLACSGDLQTAGASDTARLAVPSRSNFEFVADAMQLHCGTLDCHGQSSRNMRLFGHYGLRLNAPDNPLDQQTSAAEYDASYWSVVGLEPEAMSRVVQLQALPETLSMVRKPRGIEKHKGGQLVVPDDALDRCITSWLIGSFDGDACNTVVRTRRPQVDAGP